MSKWLTMRQILQIVETQSKARVDILYFSTFLDYIEDHDIWEQYDFEVKGHWLIIT